MFRTSCAACFLLTAALSTNAGDFDEDSGVYAGIGAGPLVLDISGLREEMDTVRPFVGYQLDRNWAIEGSYVHILRGPFLFNRDITLATLQAVGRYRLQGSWFLLGSAGLAYTRSQGVFAPGPRAIIVDGRDTVIPGSFSRFDTHDVDAIFGAGIGHEFGRHELRAVFERTRVEGGFQALTTVAYVFRF